MMPRSSRETKLARRSAAAEIKEILTQHGAGKLSEIDPKEYAVILKEAEVL